MRFLGLRLLALTLLLLAAVSGVAHAQTESGGTGRIDVVQVNGLLDPANVALIRSSIKDAAAKHSTVLVFQMNASGAVDSDVPKLLDEFKHSPVPIAVWVGPSGGAVHGAAALLACSAKYAGVASGAHVGSIDPIRYDDPSFTMKTPPCNITEKAPTLGEFIVSLDGRDGLRTAKVVDVDGKPTREARGEVHFHKLGLTAQIAHTLDSPWVAYFLFVVGLALIVFEFFTAGIGIAGFVGACAVVGGCFGFSHLPVQLWAVGLLLFGMLGLSVDVQAGGLGPWTFIGAGALVAGSIWLYGGSSRLDPKWWVLLLVIGGTVLFMLSGMTAMIRSRFSTPTIGREDLVGEMGRAEADVDPDGVVRVRDALWKARTNRATPIHAGDAVRVVSIEGIVLEVEPEAGGARDYRERRKRS